MLVLRASRLFTPLEEVLNPLVFIEDGFISKVSSLSQAEIPQNAQVAVSYTHLDVYKRQHVIVVTVEQHMLPLFSLSRNL